jgi:hypothetical protein
MYIVVYVRATCFETERVQQPTDLNREQTVDHKAMGNAKRSRKKKSYKAEFNTPLSKNLAVPCALAVDILYLYLRFHLNPQHPMSSFVLK